MNIKVTKAEKGTNTGSSANLAHYLEKENKGKSLGERKHFFSHGREEVSVHEVVRNLDANKKNLGKHDAKFYLINISPSKKELEHIGGDETKLREYTRKVMDSYAKNFGKRLEGKDLMYYAKIEHERKYHGNDPEVKAGKAKQGDKKPGLQTHIHVIVSRKDIENKRKLSPLSNHRSTSKGAVRGGFDREAFVEKAERIWDKEMKYSRAPEESFEYQLAKKQGDLEKMASIKKEAPLISKDLEKAGEPATARVLGKGKKLGSAIRRGAGYSVAFDEDLLPQKSKGGGLGI